MALSERQQAAARLLAAGRRYVDVLDGLQIAKSTLWMWRKDREFKEEIERIQRELTRDAHLELVSGQMEMLEVLHALATDDKQTGVVRRLAASDWLDRAGLVKGYTPPLTPEGELEPGVTPEDALAQLERARTHLEALIEAREVAGAGAAPGGGGAGDVDPGAGE